MSMGDRRDEEKTDEDDHEDTEAPPSFGTSPASRDDSLLSLVESLLDVLRRSDGILLNVDDLDVLRLDECRHLSNEDGQYLVSSSRSRTHIIEQLRQSRQRLFDTLDLRRARLDLSHRPPRRSRALSIRLKQLDDPHQRRSLSDDRSTHSLLEHRPYSPRLRLLHHHPNICGTQRRVDNPHLPLHPTPRLRSTLLLYLSVPLKTGLEPLLQRLDLLRPHVNVREGEVVRALSSRDESSQVRIPLFERLDARLELGEELAGVLGESGEIGRESEGLGVVAGGEGEDTEVESLDLGDALG